jgi:2-polyprenyl-3-methyl-5-hydroxy-6-metoxy-1,4-benzoquinol methylase
MSENSKPDLSNGYEGLAETFIRIRNQRIGPDVVREWSALLDPGATVLDVGCGNGRPISKVLFERGLAVYGIDASEKMVAAFREQFPDAIAECASIEDSSFFDRAFDAVISWGLIFLLKEDSQRLLIEKAAVALRPGGRLLMTAQRDPVSWEDGMTGLPSRSLGAAVYWDIMHAAGLERDDELPEHRQDEGENYYFSARKI